MSGTLKVGGKTIATHDTNTNVSTLTADQANVGSNALVVDSSGNVGIGTSNPQEALHLSASSPVLRIENTDTSGIGAIEFWDAQNGPSKVALIRYNDVNNQFQIQGNANGTIFLKPSNTFPNTSEAVRIDSSGNLLVGKTTVGVVNVGAELRDGVSDYAVTGVSSSEATALFGRNSNDGDICRFRKDNVAIGSIGVVNSNIYLGTGDTGLYFNSSVDSIYPINTTTIAGRDNAIDLGRTDVRFDDIYATNGTIQTSDQNEKQDIEELSEAEQRVAVAAKSLMRKFRWKSAVAKKGDEARIHFGIIAQDLQAAFEAEGLDAGRYGMFMSNTWWETSETYTDDEGVEQTRTSTYETAEEAPEGAVERTRLGIRYSELLAFIIAAI